MNWKCTRFFSGNLRFCGVFIALGLPFLQVAAHLSDFVVAQEHSSLYPSSNKLEVTSLSKEKHDLLQQLVNNSLPPREALQVTKQLCPHLITRAPETSRAFPNSAIETKASLSSEILFERSTDSPTTLIDSFSIFVEFSPTRVLMQHSRPRFSSERAGFSAPLSRESVRALRIEGELGADMLIFIPPVRECGVQAVVMCPRRFEKIDRLVTLPFTPRQVRFPVILKADGLVGSPANLTTKVMASILGTKSISLPPTWFNMSSGTALVNATTTFSHSRTKKASWPSYWPIDSLPHQASVESRVDIGTETAVLRTSRKRQNVELSSIHVSDIPALPVGRSTLAVQGGQCYLLAQWSEEVI